MLDTWDVAHNISSSSFASYTPTSVATIHSISDFSRPLNVKINEGIVKGCEGLYVWKIICRSCDKYSWRYTRNFVSLSTISLSSAIASFEKRLLSGLYIDKFSKTETSFFVSQAMEICFVEVYYVVYDIQFCFFFLSVGVDIQSVLPSKFETRNCLSRSSLSCDNTWLDHRSV